MVKKIRERHVHFVVLAFMIGLFLGINASFLARAEEPTHKYLDYFHQVYQLIRTEAVDVPSTKRLFYGAIRGMMHAMNDPYSRFLDEKAFEELNEVTMGKFVGVGIEITSRNNDIVVITPIENSPAMEAGIMSGDIIKRVNDKSIAGMKLPDVVKMIKGVPGSTVTLTITRVGSSEPMDFELKRLPIAIKSVEFEVIEKQGIGYIKIKNFGSDTAKDVAAALATFNKGKIKKVIVDLRNNPGGLLSAAVEISGMFLQKGQKIVSTKGRKETAVVEYKSESDPLFTGEMVVLVNEGSASASEIFAAAMRDNNRGKLVGEKTFGKGSVQKTFNLDDSIAVAITVAKYYTPSGELIHGKGIMPDFKVPFMAVGENDRKGIMEIQRKRLLEQYVTAGMEYNEKSMQGFVELLKKNNITMADRMAHFILKRRILSFKKQQLFDMEFDDQLNAAVTLLDKKKQQ